MHTVGLPWVGRLPDLTSRDGLGRACMLAGAAGVAFAGLEIVRIGVTDILVATDLSFIGASADQLLVIGLVLTFPAACRRPDR